MAGTYVPLVLLPRYTTISGPTTFTTIAMDVTDYEKAVVDFWRSAGSNLASLTINFEESMDQVTWTTCGGGIDYVDGGADNDRVEGGDGDDVLRGGTNDDVILGGGGIDQLFGDAGADRLFADSGSTKTISQSLVGQRLFGGDGIDYLYGYSFSSMWM